MSKIDQAMRQSRAQIEALELAKSLGERMLDERDLALMFWNIIVVGHFDVGDIRDNLALNGVSEHESEILYAREALDALPARQEREARREREALAELEAA